MRLGPLVLGLIVAIAAFGCNPSQPVVGGKPRPKSYRSAVSLSPSTSELLVAKMLGPQLVGRTASCDYPINVKTAPVVMNGVKPNFEAIRSQAPDIVIYDDQLIGEADAQKLKEIGFETFAFTADTVDEFVRQLYEFGALIGAESNIMDYVAEVEGAAAKATAGRPPKAPKVVFLMPDQRGGHYIAGTKSLLADIVRLSGGELAGPESDRFELANVENLVSWNPDTIICTPNFEWIANDPRLQGMSAIQKFKAGEPTLMVLQPDLALRRGARMNLLIELIAKIVGGRVGR